MFQKLLIVIGLTCASALAGPVLLTDTQIQTTDGQLFNFSFPGALPSDGTGGTLTLRVRGDFTIGASLGESLNADLEGIFQVSNLQATDANLITSFGSDDNEFSQSFVLSNTVLSQLLADGTVNGTVQYASGVDAIRSAAPFITLSVAYNSAETAVPEPSTVALMGLGLAGLLVRRFRR